MKMGVARTIKDPVFFQFFIPQVGARVKKIKIYLYK